MNNTDHKSVELARLFFREMSKIHESDEWTPAAKADALARLMELLVLEVTKEENISFTTLFARIAYACHKCEVDKKTRHWVHFFRKKMRSERANADGENLYLLGLTTVAGLIQAFFGQSPPDEILAILPEKIPFEYAEVQVRAFRRHVKVLALADHPQHDLLLVQDEEHPAVPLYVQYNIADRNEPFSPTIRTIRSTFGFPVTFSLLDVEVTDGQAPDGSGAAILRPRAIVVEPDYLLDVSTVANCFQGSSAEPVVYLLQKFLPPQATLPMLLGNIANFFLDELLHNSKAIFKETFPKVFNTSPLAFSLLDDAAIRELYQTCQKHWVTLHRMVTLGMKEAGIEPSECYLEPSFYDEKHGLQGRLDVLYNHENRSAIIELKSGKPFMPNQYGVGASHFIQTLLYDLMVRSTFGPEMEPASYILYSGLETKQLRYAPVIKSEQNEALQLRNQLVAIDRRLAAIHSTGEPAPMLRQVRAARFPHLKGYLLQNIEAFEKTYASLGDLSRRYFDAFTGFIAREHQLAKTGVQGVDTANGLAALWLDTSDEKEASFKIIKSLKIRENRANEDEAVIVFDKTDCTNPLANFRVGDIGVLYPVLSSAVRQFDSSTDPGQQSTVGNSQSPLTPHPSPFTPSQSPLSTQIFKITILEITPVQVTVRLRYKQFNLLIFSQFEEWNLEPDHMDMGFTAMYQGLYRFAQSEPQQQALLLASRVPQQPENLDDSTLEAGGIGTSLTAEQHRILQKMLVAKEYFLLWGPPGTGKTSQMLRCYAQWIFEKTDENLLLLAYTNRAVDEICEALENLGDEVRDSYLRIGSRYSTGAQFEPQLLSSKIEGVTTRKELREILERHRIFVSTLASLSNNQELLRLKKFRRVVIDEASQILEPVLAGLLPQFEQFVLIGDHKQLPAVVVQDATASAVSDEKLHGIGLYNLRNSLFERLYRRCCEQGWHWAYDHLSHQGRMHQDVMRFPGEHFYEGKLRILPEDMDAAQLQMAALARPNGQPHTHDWEAAVLHRRMVFLHTPVDRKSPGRKTNRHEAELVAHLTAFFLNCHPSTLTSRPPATPTIGIITPYRAQIAQIQECLQRLGLDTANVTVDTVERYQGGARDIILISLCTNAASQLDSLVSLSEEGVDRKLNVALTRARQQVVIVGNQELLECNETYRKLIESCKI